MKVQKFSIEVSDEAEIDFDNSYNYYFEERHKVADAFFKRINMSFEDIKQNPFAFPVAYKNIRKYVVKKFPFVIYYQIVNSTIKVIAIFHTSRNPEIWNERI
jgi:toxin ParE1/3/4